MKRTKRVGSLFLAFCMVFTMLPGVAFAETGDVDSGTPLGASGTITAFTELSAETVAQSVYTGTTKDELILPKELTATITESGGETAPGSDASKETQTTVAVECWTADPAYDGDAEGVYTFTPELELPDGVTVADGVTLPAITVTVEEQPAAPQARGAEPLSGIIEINNQSDWDTLTGNTSVIPATGGVIRLSADVKGALAITSAVTSLTIDGGTGHSIDGNIYFSKATDLTLKNLTVRPTSGFGNDALTLLSGGTLTTQGTVVLTGDSSATIGGSGVSSNSTLTITASDNTTFTGGNGAMIGGSGVNMQNGSLTLNGGSPQLTGGNGASGYGVKTAAGSLNIASGSPSFTGGVTSLGYGIAGVNISGDLTVTSPGSPAFTGTDGIGQISGIADGATVIGNLYISSGTPVFRGGAASGSEWNSFAGKGVSVSGTITISGDASPTFTGGTGAKSGTGAEGAFSLGEVTVSTSGTAAFTAGVNGNHGLNITNGLGSLNLASLTGTFTATGGMKAFALTATSYPTGLEESRKYNGTAASYTLDMTGGAVTGTMYVGGTPYVDLASNRIGTGWAWNAATATLTLDSSYGGSNIQIICAPADTINLTYTGNVNVTGSLPIISALVCHGNLNINGSGGTLTVNYTSSSSNYVALEVMGKLTIQSGTLNAISAGSGLLPQAAAVIYADEVTITGSANVTATATGAVSDGISTNPSGDGITISTSGTVTAGGKGTRYALNTFSSLNHINISNGTVTLSNSDTPANLYYGVLNHTGGMLNGNPPPVSTITITGIVEPVGGASPVKTGATVPADANYALRENIVWVDDENKTEPMADGAKFEAGKRYLCGVSAQLPSGHSFAPDVTATINGKTATVVLDGKKEAVVTYLFTAKDAADTPTITVTKHPQNVTVTQGRINATLAAEAAANNGKPVSYQWYRFIGGIGSDNVEIIPGATSNTFPIPTNLTAGTYRYLCTFNTDGNDYVDSNTAVVTVNPPSGSGDNGGSGGNGGGSTPPATAPATPQTKSNQPTAGTVPVTATAGTNGTASATVSDKAITDAIAKAQADAKAQGNASNGISVELNVTMPQGATSLSTTLSQNALQSLVSAGITSLTIGGSPVKVTFDLKALQEIQKQSNGTINISIAPQAKLSDSAKKIIGTRPVYDLTVSYGSGKTVSGFGGGTATVSVPYTPAKGEAVGALYAVYVDEKGNATRIAGSAYDANSRSILFTTTHFSFYGVGYTAPSAKFADVTNHWAKESIDYAVGRGLLSGTSETAFAPNAAMTRGMLVTALARLAGVDAKAYTKSSFTDVKTDSPFRPYIEWAYGEGIIQDIGNQQFAPDRAITREEIAVILADYAKATGYKLPVTRATAAFADASSIGSAYKDAVTAMQQAGIMMGKQNNKFNPKANATRAEASAMLHRYIKLTIDPTTAQGWALNDDGQHLYYMDGKALTGTQTIDGMKYFFNTDGTLKIGWVEDGGDWRYYSGNKAAVGWLDISNKRYYFTKNSIMVSGKWLEVGGKWYYFNADGSLARNTKIDSYEVDENGVRKSK